MNLLDRFRRWCAKPYVELAQAKFDLELSLANTLALTKRLELMAVHSVECPRAYQEGYLQGANDMQTCCAEMQERGERIETPRRVMH